MFGFGKSDSKPKKREWYDSVRNRYGFSENDDAHIWNLMSGTLGTSNLDYLLERFAPNFMRNVADVQHYKERADLWEGRYHELNEDYKILMKQNEGLQEQIAELAKQLTRALDKLKDTPTR